MKYIMKKNIFIYLAIAAFAIVTSCRTLDVAPPNSLTDEQIQEILKGDDEEAIDQIITAIGNNLQTNLNVSGATWTGYSSYPMNSQVDQDFLMSMRGNDVILGTEQVANSSSNGHTTAYRLSSDNTFAKRGVTYPYFALGALLTTNANKVLLYMTPEAAQTSAKVADFRAQALTVRAYAYMQFMERFQPAYMNGGKDGKGMPIYENYGTNAPAPISSATETYEFILTDLKEAVKLFAAKGYTDTPDDIDLGVAQFLLCRAALWAGEWDTAISTGKSLTGHFSKFIKESHYGAKNEDFAAVCAGTKDVKVEDNAFLCVDSDVNPEVIAGFRTGSGANTYLNGFANVYMPGEAGVSMLAPRIDDRLYALIDDNDFRKRNYTTQDGTYHYITDQSAYDRVIPAYANLKWGASIAKSYTERSFHVDCDQVIFRSAEAWLMLAEAYAQNGEDSNAKTTLNTLLAARTKSGASTLTCDNYSSMSGMSALKMVQLQTRIELWLENGREFYNNKRWNITVDRSGSTLHYAKQYTLSPANMVLEVPLEETNTNTHWAD